MRGMYELDHVEEEDDDCHFLEVQYFWRPEHPRTLPQPLSVRSEREVFLAENVDSIPTDAFEAKCTLVQLPEGADVPPHLRRRRIPSTFAACTTRSPRPLPAPEAYLVVRRRCRRSAGRAPGGRGDLICSGSGEFRGGGPSEQGTTATDEAGSDGAAAAAPPPPLREG